MLISKESAIQYYFWSYIYVCLLSINIANCEKILSLVYLLSKKEMQINIYFLQYGWVNQQIGIWYNAAWNKVEYNKDHIVDIKGMYNM